MKEAQTKQLLGHARRFQRMQNKLESTRRKAGVFLVTLKSLVPVLEDLEHLALERPELWATAASVLEDLRDRADKLPSIHHKAADAIREMEALLNHVDGTKGVEIVRQEIHIAKAQRFDSDAIRRDIARLVEWGEKTEQRYRALLNLASPANEAQPNCSGAAETMQGQKKRIRKS